MILVKPLTLFFPPLIERIYISSSFSSSIPWEWVFFYVYPWLLHIFSQTHLVSFCYNRIDVLLNIFEDRTDSSQDFLFLC